MVEKLDRENKINAFGHEIFETKEILDDPEVAVVIHKMGCDVFKYLGIPEEKAIFAMNECLYLTRKHSDKSIYEELAHQILVTNGIASAIPEKLVGRAESMHSQIRQYLENGSVLDYGCGDGRLAQLLAKDGFDLELADVYKNSHVAFTGLPFKPLTQTEHIPYEDNQFDNTLLLTVLHHSDDPIHVLQETLRVTRPNGKVLVIESVFGVDGQELSTDQRAHLKPYLALTSEQQRKLNMFFDHFYNRVIHYTDNPSNKVNVPFNFNTPETWEKLFEENGFRQDRVIHLGADQPTVPEYHTLHVLRAQKN